MFGKMPLSVTQQFTTVQNWAFKQGNKDDRRAWKQSTVTDDISKADGSASNTIAIYLVKNPWFWVSYKLWQWMTNSGGITISLICRSGTKTCNKSRISNFVAVLSLFRHSPQCYFSLIRAELRRNYVWGHICLQPTALVLIKSLIRPLLVLALHLIITKAATAMMFACKLKCCLFYGTLHTSFQKLYF